MFEGFEVVQGRVWKDGTPRWEFRCKLHGTETLNTRGLEPRKLKDEEGKMMINRQRNMMVKAKKNYSFKYLLFYKAINKDSKEKEYIKTLKYLNYIYYINLNPFLFKIYKIAIIKY